MRGRRSIALGVVAALAVRLALPALHVLFAHGYAHGTQEARPGAAHAGPSACCCHEHGPAGGSPARGESLPAVTATESHETCAICAALAVQAPPSLASRVDVTVRPGRDWTRAAPFAPLVRAAAKDYAHAPRAPPGLS